MLCDGWTGCSDVDEYLGFNNKSCSAGVPPKSKVYGNTVGPVLRDFSESVHWKSWNVDVLSKGPSGVEVTLKNYYTGSGEPRCKNHYLADYSEKKDACKDSEWADRVHLHKDRVKWTLKEVKGTGGCFNIINDEKPAGCLRYLSAQENCDDRYLKLVGKDDGSGLQRWKLEKVGSPTKPSVPSPDVPLPGSQCVSTGPQNCASCCQTKMENGSFMEDVSCVDIEKYPQCHLKPALVAASAGSSNAGTVSFSPTPGATECTVTEVPVNGGKAVKTTITHLSFPVTTTHPVGLDSSTEYNVELECRINGMPVDSINTHSFATPDSDGKPGIVNLHQTSETSASFDIVPPVTGDCAPTRYDVSAKPSVGSSVKMSVQGTHVDMQNLVSPSTYEITVRAVCKGGTTELSAVSLLTTMRAPAPSPSIGISPSPPLTIPAPTFHTISVFGPHPTISLGVDASVPDNSTVNLQTSCTNGFSSLLQVPAIPSETKVQLNNGLPVDSNCTFTASISKGLITSPEVSETRVLPSSTDEAPRLERWTPQYKNSSAQVTVVAPLQPNCTITSYTVTTTLPSPGASLVGRKLLQTDIPPPVTTPAPGPVTITDIRYETNSPKTYNLAVVGNCDDGSKTPEGHLSVTFECPKIQNCDTYTQDGSCQCQKCIPGFSLNVDTGFCAVNLPSPSPSPTPTGPPSFVEFRGDGTLVATGEKEQVDFTFTIPCGSTFSESDPDGTTKCDWERVGATDLSALTPGLASGVYQYTVSGAACPASQAGVCDWSAYLNKDNPVSSTCKQTDGLAAGICRTSIDLKGACGSQCELKQGETKTLSFTVNPDGTISFP